MPEANQGKQVERSRKPRVGRLAQAQHRAVFAQRRAANFVSQRQYAAETGLSRTTLQYWLNRAGPAGVDPAIAAFFATAAGVVLLHRIVIAAHLAVGWFGAGGVQLVCLFLTHAGLAPFVASSHGSQHATAAEIEANILSFEKVERPRLAKEMPPKDITVCEDETFLEQGVCLVAAEPVSGFVLVEEYAEDRSAETWKAVFGKAITGLPVTVKQITSDEAKALHAHADALKANRSPDLFHVQHAVCAALALAMRRHEDQATAVERLEAELARHRREQEVWRATPHGPGRPPNFEGRILHVEGLLAVARARLQDAPPAADWRDPMRAISLEYHPFNLETGACQTADHVAAQLQTAFDRLRAIARAAGVSDSALAGVEKAARVAPAMRATLAWYEARVDEHVEQLGLTAEHEQIFRTHHLPAAYLRRAGPKIADLDRRARALATAKRLVEGAPTVPDDVRLRLEQAARLCADLFQRSSSCVEGRNGRLSQYQHALRRLNPNRQAALTIVHNYLITRPDGTTAAERFFGTPPASLIAWLQEHVSVPARPARSRRVRENQRRVGGSE